jgi:hypothetical protein
MAATSSEAIGWNRPGEILTVLPSVPEAATPLFAQLFYYAQFDACA